MRKGGKVTENCVQLHLSTGLICQTIFRDSFKKHSVASPSILYSVHIFLILSHSMLPCIIFSVSSFSLPSSSDSISLPSRPSSSPCVLLYLPSAPPHQPTRPPQPPPLVIAFLSSRHLTERGSSSKSPKAQSSTIVHTTKLER